jgi:hypothetical protein
MRRWESGKKEVGKVRRWEKADDEKRRGIWGLAIGTCPPPEG